MGKVFGIGVTTLAALLLFAGDLLADHQLYSKIIVLAAILIAWGVAVGLFLWPNG